MVADGLRVVNRHVTCKLCSRFGIEYEMASLEKSRKLLEQKGPTLALFSCSMVTRTVMLNLISTTIRRQRANCGQSAYKSLNPNCRRRLLGSFIIHNVAWHSRYILRVFGSRWLLFSKWRENT